MSSEGRSTESRRVRGGRNRSISGRDSIAPPATRTDSRRAPGRQEFFTDSTNTSYIPSPSPARPSGRPRQTLSNSIGGGVSFKAALKAALNNKENDSPASRNRPDLPGRSKSLASAPPTSSVKRSPVQVSEFGSPNPNVRPASARDVTRTPSPLRRFSEGTPLVSPASFFSESSEPPQALPEIYRQIEDEELIAEAGGTDDDLSGSVKTTPDSRRFKRLSGPPSGLSNSFRAFSPIHQLEGLEVQGQQGQQEQREEKAESREGEEEGDRKSDFGSRLEPKSKIPQLPRASGAKTPSSRSSSSFEEIVTQDPDMLARDEKRVKAIIDSDRKAFSKAARGAAVLTAENLRKQNAASPTPRSSQGSRSHSSGEPSLHVPSAWGRKARNNTKWMESIVREKNSVGADLSNVEATGQANAPVASGAASKSVSNWLQTAASTPLPEAGDSLQSTPAEQPKDSSQKQDRQAFSRAQEWEQQHRNGPLSPGRQSLSMAALRERSIERLEKSAVATNRLTALGHTRSQEKLVSRSSDQDLGGRQMTIDEISFDHDQAHGRAADSSSNKGSSSRSSSERRLEYRKIPLLTTNITQDSQAKKAGRSPTRIPQLSNRPIASKPPSVPSERSISPGTSHPEAAPAELSRPQGVDQASEPVRPASASSKGGVHEAIFRPDAEQPLPSIESEVTSQQADIIPTKADSHDLLRRFARASSSSPAPNRSPRPETRGSNRSQGSRSPSAPRAQPLISNPQAEIEQLITAAHEPVSTSVETDAIAPESAASDSLVLVEADPTYEEEERDTVPQLQGPISNTPAAGSGKPYLKTPKVVGGWVDTPVATAKKLGVILEDISNATGESEEGNLLAAARKAVGVENAQRLGSKLERTEVRDLEALARTAPDLPRSALTAIIEHAKKKNKGEEGPEGEETLQLDESTIQSLEELLVQEDQEPERVTQDDVVEKPVAAVSSEKPTTDKSKVLEARDHQVAKEDEALKENIAPKEDQKQPKQSILGKLAQITQVFSSGEAEKVKKEEQLQQLSKLSAPGTEIKEVAVKQEQTKASASESSDRLGRPASPNRKSRPSLSVSIDDSPKRPKKPKKAVAVVAPDEECDQAGEFHDFIWPCENCQRRAKAGLSADDEMIGVVQWQTVQIPRLWRWPTVSELQKQTTADKEGKMELNRSMKLQTWIPRLTTLGWILVVLGIYAYAEYKVTEAYTPPFYAETMEGYGVDYHAPRPPFVLTQLIWRSSFGRLLSGVWTVICVIARVVTGVLGLDAGLFGHGEEVGAGVASAAPTVKYVYREVWEPAVDVGRGVPDVGLGQDEVWY